MKTDILSTGLSGLVGSKIKQQLCGEYQFENLDLSHPTQSIDIINFKQVIGAFTKSPASIIIHLAAYTNVTGAWKQNGDKQGLAYRVNVNGTKNIVQACRETEKHLIHISTAYVFDGQKKEPYLETDSLNPIEWYGQTKALAEDVVTNSDINWTILRIDQPFRSDPFSKKDVVHRIIDGIKDNNLYPQFTNHYFGPTFIDDFAKVVKWTIQTHALGLFHAAAGEQWTDYDFASLINKRLQLGGNIKKGDLSDYLKTLNRPYQKNTALNCDKLKKQLDFSMLSISEAVSRVKV